MRLTAMVATGLLLLSSAGPERAIAGQTQDRNPSATAVRSKSRIVLLGRQLVRSVIAQFVVDREKRAPVSKGPSDAFVLGAPAEQKFMVRRSDFALVLPVRAHADATAWVQRLDAAGQPLGVPIVGEISGGLVRVPGALAEVGHVRFYAQWPLSISFVKRQSIDLEIVEQDRQPDFIERSPDLTGDDAALQEAAALALGPAGCTPDAIDPDCLRWRVEAYQELARLVQSNDPKVAQDARELTTELDRR